VRPGFNLYDRSVREIRARLLDTHKLPLAEQDVEWIGQAMRAFYTDGPDIHYGRSLARDAAGPSYRTLMTAIDTGGESRSYLATEEAFAFIKDLQARNTIVPVVGDFAGPRAIRATGDYIRKHGEVVEAFYSSNVEVYLNREKLTAFCRNLASLPFEWSTPFIDSKGMRTLGSKLRACLPPETR
jgi:hypothetical protein